MTRHVIAYLIPIIIAVVGIGFALFDEVTPYKGDHRGE